MDRKFCDKHSKEGKLKEIKGKYYLVSVWEENTENDKEKKVVEMDLCPMCFKKAKIRLKNNQSN